MPKTIQELRAEIDIVDDKLFALLKERIAIVKQVGQIKEKDGARCFVRPGREAEMVRRVYKDFKDSDFSAHAAAIMWRQVISASLNAEAPLKVSVFAPEANPSLFWYAREYFGEFTPLKRESSTQRVIAEVMDGRSQIGLLPLPYENAVEDWWLHLARESEYPRIFAQVPFVTSKAAYKKSGALAIAYVEPEPTGDDISFYVLRTEQSISQSKLNAAFAKAQLEVSWCASASLHAERRMVEIKGFHLPDSEAIKLFKAEAGASLQELHYLGSCATPIFTD